MVKDDTLNNVVALSQFQVVSDLELQEINGGIFPIVIAGVAITAKAAAWYGGAFVGGAALAYWLN